MDLDTVEVRSTRSCVVTAGGLFGVTPRWTTNPDNVADIFVGSLEVLVQAFGDDRGGRGLELSVPVIVKPVQLRGVGTRRTAESNGNGRFTWDDSPDGMVPTPDSCRCRVRPSDPSALFRRVGGRGV